MDFIIGYEVKLSGNHNCKGVPTGTFYDICDELKGRYPKDFKWLGWHPNCRCYVVPIIKSEERFWEDEDKRGDDNEEITELPDNFKQWAAQNKDRIARAESRGTQPYFVRDNRERVKRAIKQGEVRSGGDYILDPSGTPSSSGGDIVGRFLDILITKKEAISLLRELATNSDHEEAYVFLPDGRVYHKVGVLNKVPLSEDELKLFEGGVFIHNHPNTTFSPNDIFTAIRYKFKEIHVVTPITHYIADVSTNSLSMEKVHQIHDKSIIAVTKRVWKVDSKRAQHMQMNAQLYEIEEFLKQLGLPYYIKELDSEKI